jgi:hypothetical protein
MGGVNVIVGWKHGLVEPNKRRSGTNNYCGEGGECSLSGLKDIIK